MENEYVDVQILVECLFNFKQFKKGSRYPLYIRRSYVRGYKYYSYFVGFNGEFQNLSYLVCKELFGDFMSLESIRNSIINEIFNENKS